MLVVIASKIGVCCCYLHACIIMVFSHLPGYWVSEPRFTQNNNTGAPSLFFFFFFFFPGSEEEEKSTQWHESWCAHHLTYCWISQLSTHNPGINAGEVVVTDCAPLVIVADLQPSFIWINSTHKTNSTIGTRNCSIYWNCNNNCKNIFLLSQTTWPFLQCDQNVAINFWLYYL